MQLIDTHCHLADADFPIDQHDALKLARDRFVEQIISVGTDEKTSQQALNFASQHSSVWASVGVHPHDAKNSCEFLKEIDWTHPRLIAVGEIGLDYHYNFSPPATQKKVFRSQIEIALEHKMPLIFHVREAFDDFWEIVDAYEIPKAVVHSFSDNLTNAKRILAKDWYVGVNGIATFTKDPEQILAYKSLPIERILLETDAPYLAPSSRRGQINQPAFVYDICLWLADFYQIPLEKLAKQTTQNAVDLFQISC